MAGSDASEGQAVRKPGGAEEDSRLREGNRHLHLAYDEEEESPLASVTRCSATACLPFVHALLIKRHMTCICKRGQTVQFRSASNADLSDRI